IPDIKKLNECGNHDNRLKVENLLERSKGKKRKRSEDAVYSNFSFGGNGAHCVSGSLRNFEVKAVMAPVSHLLVYYITEDGEPISDVISFDIKLLLKQRSASLSEKSRRRSALK
ncbi:unnamed protein product, partial [Timema podura]|nr:unnamed protein product [Timema podura]